MDARELMEAIEDVGYTPRSYSGRGMFGRDCVGVAIPREVSTFSFAVELVRELVSNAEDEEGSLVTLDALAQLKASEDSLGHDRILYFPRVAWPEGTEEEDSDEDVG